jgi:hypothetical protein
MYKRPHHQIIDRLLDAFNPTFLQETGFFFGGGTRIALELDEYRESVDIDFLGSSNEGFSALRLAVGQTLGSSVLKQKVVHAREVRVEAHKISTVLELDGVRVKVEFVREGQLQLKGEQGIFQVPSISRSELAAQKLMANSDRGLDSATNHRDMLDLVMMCNRWGFDIHAWEMVEDVYKDSLRRNTFAVIGLLTEKRRFNEACERLKIEDIHKHELAKGLDALLLKIPRNEQEEMRFQERCRALSWDLEPTGFKQMVQQTLNGHINQKRDRNIDLNHAEEAAIVEALKGGAPLLDAVKSVIELSPGCVQQERARIKESVWLSSEPEWLAKVDKSLRIFYCPK